MYGNINITYNNIYYRKDIEYKYIQNMNKKYYNHKIEIIKDNKADINYHLIKKNFE